MHYVRLHAHKHLSSACGESCAPHNEVGVDGGVDGKDDTVRGQSAHEHRDHAALVVVTERGRGLPCG